MSAGGRHAITGRGVCRSIKDGGGAAGGLPDMACAGPHPLPTGAGKTGGVFLGGIGYILQPFKTTSSKQGGTGKTGGHDF